MNKIIFLFEKSLVRIFKIEIIFFVFFIFSTIAYHFYDDSHKYNVDFPFNCQGISAFLITLLYGFFFFLIIAFPFLFFLQLFFAIKFKILKKSGIVLVFFLTILYFGSVISVFSLYSIKQKQTFMTRN